jgi:hypothetical protein
MSGSGRAYKMTRLLSVENGIKMDGDIKVVGGGSELQIK